ncbi:MAG: AAA family ATPase [Clostridia bacterium]|nr:AAA family ATPase [Clostridia bacterium]
MEVVIFIGIQASGKSTFYKEKFFKTHMRVNLDMLKTRKREEILLEALIKAKQPFVVDNTNPTAEDRKKYIELAKRAEFKVIGYFFQSNVDESVLRNRQREGKERIPLIGIRNTYAKLQLPSLGEGFDIIYSVRIDEENRFVVEEWKNEV